MNLITDLVIANTDDFDALLADVDNTMQVDLSMDAGISIDDVVGIISICREVLEDRSAWWKVRREVYGRFVTHDRITTRSLAALPDSVRDEVGAIDPSEFPSIAAAWLNIDQATPSDSQSAVRSLEALSDACTRAAADGKCVMLRTTQPANDFETAFQKLNSKQRANFQKAFDSWDEAKKHEAHQRYNHYCEMDLDDSLNLVLSDFTRPKTSKINLKTDQRTVRKHLAKRVKAYIKEPLPQLGDAAAPITMIALTFDIEYEGYVDLNISTRPNAAEDCAFEERTDECLEFPHWHEGLLRLAEEGLPLRITLHDSSKVVLDADSDEDEFDNHVGDMLRDALIEARDGGEFAKLPLAPECFIWVSGTHTNYCWPDPEQIAQDGRIR